MRRVLVTVAALAALGGVGCDSGSTVSTDEEAHAAVETFLATCAGEQPLAAVDLVTEPVREELVKAPSILEGCVEILALDVPEPAPDGILKAVLRNAEVSEVRTSGGFGTAVVRTGTGERSEIELESSGDAWYLANPLWPPTPLG